MLMKCIKLLYRGFVVFQNTDRVNKINVWTWNDPKGDHVKLILCNIDEFFFCLFINLIRMRIPQSEVKGDGDSEP